MLGDLDTSPKDITSIEALTLRGRILAGGRRFQEAAETFRECAERARAMGWLTRAADAYYRVSLAAYARSDYAGSLAAQESRLELETRLSSTMGMGRSYYGIAMMHGRLGNRGELERAFQEAQRLIAQSGDHEYLAKLWGALAARQAAAGDLRGGIESGRKAQDALLHVPARAAVERFQADRLRVEHARVDMILNEAGWWVSLGAQAEAEAALERARVAADAAADLSGQARVHLLRGKRHQARAEHLSALEEFEASARLYKQAGNRAARADALREAATAGIRLGAYAESRERLVQAESILSQLGAKPLQALASLELGRALTLTGEYELAMGKLDSVMVLARALGDTQLEVDVLGAQGQCAYARGELGLAIEWLSQARTRQESMGRPRKLAGILVDLAAARASMGESEQALGLLDKAERLYTDAGDPYRLAIVRRNQAALLVRAGQHDQATETLKALLATERLAGHRARIAGTLLALGDAYRRSGHLDLARDRFREALSESKAIGDPGGVLHARLRLGDVLTAGGSLEEALSLYTRAAREARKLSSAELLAYADAGVADVERRRGNDVASIQAGRRAAVSMARIGRALAEGEGATARAALADVYQIGMAASLHAGRARDFAWFLDRSRASSLLAALGGRDRIRATVVPAALRAAQNAARAVEARARSEYERVRRRGRLADVKRAGKRLEAARDSVLEVDARVQRDARRQASIAAPRIATTLELQARLAPGVALVTYGFCFGHTLALVVTQSGQSLHRLGPAAAVRGECRSLVDAATDLDAKPETGALRKLLVEPLALGKDVTTVLVSPEGPLCQLPYALLFQRPVALLPSATTLLQLPSTARVEAEQVLALGDPDYTGTSPGSQALYYRGRVLDRLQASRSEATSVGDVVLTGAKASEGGLSQALHSREHWRAVHLACHGLVVVDNPLLSSLALTKSGHDDGFLTMMEVLQLDVPADLVVLSACETAVGKFIAGEGLLGFTRAFMYAGSPRVICSLWKVDDEATRALMVKFYELWNPKEGRGLGAAEALEQAQAFVRGHEKWKHPYFWAAWVLWGLAE